jgi:hypothetical protein
VTASGSRGAIVIDTDVFSADLIPTSRLVERYAPIILGRPAFISFQTAAELRESIRTLRAPRERLDAGRTASYSQALPGFGLVLAECGKHKFIVL